MTRSRLARWTAVLALVIALLPGAASAQEDGTIKISSTFYMDWLSGTVGDDLAGAFDRGEDHVWTLTLYGTTQSHHKSGSFYLTEIQATPFDLEFFGPDAATLNGIVSAHIAGGDVLLRLWNNYSSNWNGGRGGAVWELYLFGLGDVGFWTGEMSNAWNPLFPSDADGYPVVGPDPLTIWAEGAILGDSRPGNNGWIESGWDLVTIEGSVGEPDPGEPAVLAVADASVWEGDKGTTAVAVAVTLSKASSQEITVSYRTFDGTAKAKEDYTATSGTLTFQPGETSRAISVSIKGDRKREPDETFFVELSNAVGATIGDGVATVTILNDD